MKTTVKNAVKELDEKELIYQKIMLGTELSYRAVYYLDLQEKSCEMFYPRRGESAEKGTYNRDWIVQRVREGGVIEENVAPLIAFMSIGHISKILADKDNIYMKYRRNTETGKLEWCQIAFYVVNRVEGQPVGVTMTLRSVDELIEKEVTQKQLLAHTVEREQAAKDAKTMFFAQMSHDIRTPMNAILGMAAIAETCAEDPQKVRASMRKLIMAGDHLLSLINDILDLSKIESGRLELAKEKVRLSVLADHLMNLVASQAAAKEQKIRFTLVEVTHDSVVGDFLRLKQMFMNLISNAIKYTPDGGEIQVSLQELPTEREGYASYKFVCADNGYGMSENYLEHLFDPFERCMDEPVKNIPGTGLGMTIVENIVRALNGTIEVESQVRQGTTFTVNFDLRLIQPGEYVRDTANFMLAYDKEEQVTLKDFENKDFTDKRVLLVEDNELNREIAKTILKKTGVTVEAAENGRQAVEMYEHSKEDYYQMIFMDIQMPGVSGLDATRIIREMSRKDAPWVPIIAMTANVFSDDMDRAKQAGISDYIIKPISLKQLLGVLEHYC